MDVTCLGDLASATGRTRNECGSQRLAPLPLLARTQLLGSIYMTVSCSSPREFGATHGVNASNADAVRAIWEIIPGGVDYAFDAVGASVTALQIVHAVKQGGPGSGGSRRTGVRRGECAGRLPRSGGSTGALQQ
jgi:hypothetical protein